MSRTSFHSKGPRGQAGGQAGFTLLELIITLAISAILIGLAVPSLQSFMGDSEMTSTSNEFVYSLQTARSEAIKRAGPVGLCPSAQPLADDPTCSATSYANGWIVFFDADGNGQRNAAEALIQQSEARSPAFTFTPDTALAERVYFGESGTSTNPVGIPLSGDIDISLAGTSERRVVRVSANGRISTTVTDVAVTP